MISLTIYNFVISSFSFFIYIASFFNEKAKKWIEGRVNIFERIKSEKDKFINRPFWFHAASLGEFEQGRPLIEKLKQLYPDTPVLLTFFSPSGYEVRKNYELADLVIYLPVDTKKHAAEFIFLTNPKAAFFIKYEFWHYYLNELKYRNIPVFSVSSIFRSNQLFFKPYGTFYRNILKNISLFFVQNDDSLNLLKNIGIDAVKTGDTRFDRVMTLSLQRKELALISRFKGSATRLLVIGSSWDQDIEVLSPVLNNFFLNKIALGEIKVVIAPHEISMEKITALKKQITKEVVLYSEAQNKDLSLYDFMVIDNIGLLSSIYQYADFAYIGGGFGKGIHNTLEAATYGIPVFWGPKYQKFQEAHDLITLGGGFVIHNTKEFENQFNFIATSIEAYKHAAKVNQQYVVTNAGATDKIIEKITGYIK